MPQRGNGSIGINGMTVTNVLGCGAQHGRTSKYRGVTMDMNLLPKIQVDIVVSKYLLELLLKLLRKHFIPDISVMVKSSYTT